VWKVLKRDGIDQLGGIASERFMGNAADGTESRTGAHV
jgi:hypothetical protein